MFKRLVLVLLGCVVLLEARAYMNIVAATGATQSEADLFAARLKHLLRDHPAFLAAQQEEGTYIIGRVSGNHYIATIEPIYDADRVMTLLFAVRDVFPDAYVFTHRDASELGQTQLSEAASSAAVPVETAGAASQTAIEEKKTWTVELLAVLLLGLIGIALVWRASRQQHEIETIDKTLKHEQQELEAVLDHQEEMMLNVGHKIQRPAKEIFERSDKVLQTELTALQDEQLRSIRDNDSMLLDITNDMIDFLKLKSDKLVLRNEQFNLNNVLDEVAGIVSARARGSKVEFIYDIDRAVPPKFIGDPLRLGQILMNLTDNALKFTHEGEVRISIRPTAVQGAKMHVLFSISDTGVGIAQEKLETLFDPFVSDPQTNDTGLGLFITKHLSVLMGGSVTVKSVPDRGSEFIISIPLEMADPNEKRFYRLPAKAYTGKRVLIIEQQPSAADALKKMLEYFKNEVLVRTVMAVGNAPEILQEFDVIVVAENTFTDDIKDALYGVKALPECRVVLAGSMLDEKHAIEDIKPLIDARIMKPLTLQRVYDLIVDLYEDSIDDVDTENVTPRYTKPTAVKDVKFDEIPETPNVCRSSFNDFNGSSLLIVEDNLVNQKVLQSLLKESGIKIEIANDGVEALDAVENPDSHFDLILMDINMPVMDGYEATRHIRSVPDFANLPIVSLTGLGLPEEVAKMYSLGMDGHLIKPVKVGRLYTVFSRHLKHNGEHACMQEDRGSGNHFVNTRALSAQDGLRRASDDEELYLEILGEFVKVYASADQTLALLLKTQEYTKAAKLCFDIKGVGANIGADELAQVCEKLYRALGSDDLSDITVKTDRFDRELHNTLTAIRHYVA